MPNAQTAMRAIIKFRAFSSTYARSSPFAMGPFDLLLHLMSFAAPALALALFLPLAARLLLRSTAGRCSFWLQAALVFAAALGVLAVGLWWFGHDGKMTTYGALVAVAATTQWLALRAWR
jgi:hypothetical protein